MNLTTILIFLLIFSVIVVFHEWGHYYFAKKAGIRVREFALGMGPKLFSKQDKEGTTYTIRMLPLGGYVRLAGLNEEDGIQPGMTIGLGFNNDNQVNAINLSKKEVEDQLPFQVDSLDLVDQMNISGYALGNDQIQEFSVVSDAVITEEDGTKVLVAPRSTRYESASPWNKIKTNIAGPINNFILSIVVFSFIGLVSGGVASNAPVIGEIVENSPALSAGLVSGDEVVAIGDTAINSWSELVSNIQANPGKTLEFEIVRDGQSLTIPVNIESVTDKNSANTYGQIGITRSYDTSISSRLLFGFTQTWEVIAMVVTTILGMFTRGLDVNQLGGPVAMAQMTNEVVGFGWLAILSFMGMISANLGIMNLLPIPALDGGKIVLNIYEAVRGRPLAQEKEGIITLIGVAFLGILMLIVTWNDIMRAFF